VVRGVIFGKKWISIFWKNRGLVNSLIELKIDFSLHPSPIELKIDFPPHPLSPKIPLHYFPPQI